MNCKPGDLAVIINGDLPLDLPLLGKIVRLIMVRGSNEFGPLWDYEGSRLFDADGWEIERISDSCLRPIRDPGDDAVDETSLRLGKPNYEEVAA